MTTKVRYIGNEAPYFPPIATGVRDTWRPGVAMDVTQQQATALLATGVFEIDQPGDQTSPVSPQWIVDVAGNPIAMRGPRGETLGGAVDVRAFGAVGDGVADDTAAIQAAIDFAATNRKNRVFIPASSSDYVISAPLLLRSGVKVYGESSTNRLAGFADNYPGIRKVNNSTASVVNHATSVPYSVDCFFYTESELFPGQDFATSSPQVFYPQKSGVSGLYFKGGAPSPVDVGVHVDFGSGYEFYNIDTVQVTDAIRARDIWASKLYRVRTTGKIRFTQTGTSVIVENCSAMQGFFLQGLMYSSMVGCTSDGTVSSPAYEFVSCYGLKVDTCGAELTQTGGSQVGVFKFSSGNRSVTLVEPFVLQAAGVDTPAISTGDFDYLTVIGGRFSLAGAAPAAYDVYCAGNSSVHFINTKFTNSTVVGGAFSNPIRASVVGSASASGVVTVDINQASSSFSENGSQVKRMVVTTTSASPTATTYNAYFKSVRGLTGADAFSDSAFDDVAFGQAMPNANYRVSVIPTSVPPGYVWVSDKTVDGFRVNCSASGSFTYDWSVVF
jgi:hypothetical protein